MELVDFIIKHPHPNPPPSSGMEYLYKSPPLAGGARGGGLKLLNLGISNLLIPSLEKSPESLRDLLNGIKEDFST